MAQIQLPLGAGDADVSQPPFLLQLARFRHRAAVRKQPLLHSDQEHQRELQPLGHVQGHQLHAVLAGGALPLAGFQRSVGQKGVQPVRFFRVHSDHHRIGMGDEIAAGVDQFFQVLDPDLALVVPGLFVHRPQTAVGDDVLDPFRQWPTVAVTVQRLDQVQEPAHRVGGPATQSARRQQAQRGLPQ